MGTNSMQINPAEEESVLNIPYRGGGLADEPADTAEAGTIQIHHHVIATIARQAALEVRGVCDMSASFVDGLVGIIGKSGDRGIRVDDANGGVVVEVHLVVEYGVRIPQVAWQVQRRVREAIQRMTGKPVKAVNVVVQDVRQPARRESRDPKELEA